MRPSIIVTTAGVHGPQTSPQSSLPWALRIQFCCAVRPTDTQCPSTGAAGAFPDPAGLGGSGCGCNSKSWTTRASVADVVAAFAFASGLHRQLHDVTGQRGVDAFTTGAIPNEKRGSLLTQNPAVLDPEHAGRIVAGSAHNAGQTVSGRLENVDAHRRPATRHPRARHEIGGMHAGDRAQRQRSTECEELQWVSSTSVTSRL